MQPRSAAGRAVLAEVAGKRAATESHKNTRIIKTHKQQRVGVRLAAHPISRQVVISQLYRGYPALETGRLFVGDVLLAVNGVRVTEVDMALQLIKMHQTVELTTTNVYIDEAGLSQPVSRAVNPPPPPPLPSAEAAVGDLLGGLELDDSPPRSSAVAAAATVPSADPFGGDDFLKAMEAPPTVPTLMPQPMSPSAVLASSPGAPAPAAAMSLIDL